MSETAKITDSSDGRMVFLDGGELFGSRGGYLLSAASPFAVLIPGLTNRTFIPFQMTHSSVSSFAFPPCVLAKMNKRLKEWCLGTPVGFKCVVFAEKLIKTIPEVSADVSSGDDENSGDTFEQVKPRKTFIQKSLPYKTKEDGLPTWEPLRH